MPREGVGGEEYTTRRRCCCVAQGVRHYSIACHRAHVHSSRTPHPAHQKDRQPQVGVDAAAIGPSQSAFGKQQLADGHATTDDDGAASAAKDVKQNNTTLTLSDVVEKPKHDTVAGEFIQVAGQY